MRLLILHLRLGGLKLISLVHPPAASLATGVPRHASKGGWVRLQSNTSTKKSSMQHAGVEHIRL